MKKCIKCDELKEVSGFYKRGGSCKECCKSYAKRARERNRDEVLRKKKEYSKTTAGKLCQKKADAKRDPVKIKARRSLNHAVRDGNIVRPLNCSCCNILCKPEAHHYSYKEEHWLDVTWLCAPCHVREHQRLRDSE